MAAWLGKIVIGCRGSPVITWPGVFSMKPPPDLLGSELLEQNASGCVSQEHNKAETSQPGNYPSIVVNH